MKSAAPHTPPSFHPEGKAVVRTAADVPAYVERSVPPRTAYFSTLTAVAVAAEVVTVVDVAVAAAETLYDAGAAGTDDDSMPSPATEAY